MITGLISGLMAVLLQSLSYVLSKHFVARYPIRGTRNLLVVSHLTMGAASIIPLLLLLYGKNIGFDIWPPLFLSTLFYALAQVCFFAGLRFSAPSQLAPVLGTKVMFVALLGVLFFAQKLGMQQVFALILCLIGAILSSWNGVKMQYLPLMTGLLASACFAFSDLYVNEMFKHLMMFDSIFTRALIAALMEYVLCAVVCLPLFAYACHWKQFVPALPYSASWFTSGLMLFASIALAGPVFAGVVQSSRALVSVLLGAAVAGLGFYGIEPRMKQRILTLRIIAAILIMLSVILYMSSGNHS